VAQIDGKVLLKCHYHFRYSESDLKRQGETERKTQMDKEEKMTFHHIAKSLLYH